VPWDVKIFAYAKMWQEKSGTQGGFCLGLGVP